MFFYVHGEVISSDLDFSPLNLSPAISNNLNHRIKISHNESLKFNTDLVDNQTSVLKNYGYLYSKNEAFYEFFKGNELKVSSLIEVDKELLINILNYPLASIFFQNNCLCIHGSALFYRGKTILILGTSGSGKSSLAASLINVGAKLLSEDTLIFDPKKDHNLYCSYPIIKLSDEIINYLKFEYIKKIKLKRNRLSRNAYIIDYKNMIKKTKRVDLVIYPSWSNNFTYSKLNTKDSVMSFIESGFFNFQETKTDLLKSINKIIGNSASYKVRILKELKSINKFINLIDLIIDED